MYLYPLLIHFTIYIATFDVSWNAYDVIPLQHQSERVVFVNYMFYAVTSL